MPPLPEGDDGDAVRPGHHRRHLPLRRAAPPRSDETRPAGHAAASPGPMWQRRHGGAARSWPSATASSADAWSVTSWTSLRDDALEVERWNRLHPDAEPPPAYVTERARHGRRTPWSPSPTTCGPCPTRWPGSSTGPTPRSGTDGFGRSDTRAALRSLLRGRRRPPRGGRAAAARARRARRSRHGGRRPIADLGIDPHPARRSRPEAPVHGVMRAAPRRWPSRSSAPSGTRKDERATVRPELDGDRRRRGSTASRADRATRRRPARRSESSSTRRTDVASASTTTTDDATSSRHSSIRSASVPASRLHAIGRRFARRRVIAGAPPRARRG